MRNRRWICLLLAVLMVLACTACGAKANDDASGDVRTLTDGKNRTVVGLTAKTDRYETIVVLIWHKGEII